MGLAAFSLGIFSGCTDGGNTPVSTNDGTKSPVFVRLPERLDKNVEKVVTATKFIYAAQGGTLQLRDTYRAAPDSHLVIINISLSFQPGDLPYDASLSITIDDVLFLADVDLTFGPHGIVFNRPARLTVMATGLDLDINTTRQLKLYYNANGVWTLMQGGGVYFAGSGTLGAQGLLPHFSQYAFGRVED